MGGFWLGKQCLLTAYKAKSRVLEFVTPKTKKEAQKLTGLLGFWRHHMPLLSAILKPLNSVTRKKYGFSWGPEQTAAFEAAKTPVQTALDLWPVQKGPVELQVSLDDDCKCWRLWLLESDAAGGRQGPRGRRTPPPPLRGWVLSHGPHRGRQPRLKSSGSQEPRSARSCAGQRPRLCRVTGPLPGPQRTAALGPPRASLWPSLSDPQLLWLDTWERVCQLVALDEPRLSAGRGPGRLHLWDPHFRSGVRMPCPAIGPLPERPSSEGKATAGRSAGARRKSIFCR